MTPSRPSVNISAGVFAPADIDRVSQLAWTDVQHTHINQRISPATDPMHTNWIHKFHLENGPTFLRGRVVDTIAYTNCHKVQFAMAGSMWCQLMSPTALQPMGARHIGQLPVGCEVLVLWFKDDTSGIIVGVLPDAQTDSRSAMADFISQQARSGLLVDEAHNYPVWLSNASLITDWSAGRPFDATTEGEQGNITETGLLDFIDSFMSVKRTDEECGLWTFWHDQLTRLAGHNLQIWTTGYEREDLDDEGEFDKIEGHTPYYWEALGAFELGLNVSQDIPTQCWQKDPQLQGYSATEPCDDHQQAFYRLRDFYGYLGQAHKRVLCLPPLECGVSSDVHFGEESLSSFVPISSEDCTLPSCIPHKLNTLNKELIYPGVFDEDLALTGRWSVRSAHEIILSKYVPIPAPKQMVRPENPNGDNATDYHAAGHPDLGSGDEHKVVGEIEVPVGDDPSQIRAAGFLDTHAFVFNWIGDHPFYYHKYDWLIPEERDLTYLAQDCTTIAFDPPTFDRLRCHQFLEAPPAISMHVDHRYGAVKYYPNHSYFGMLADGGIVLGCGFGSEIKLANGQIWITAPGDINFQAGRDVVSFAGYDFIMRAKNSFDLSATNGDGRIKAKEQLWLASTGECGGILIQSKAINPVCDFSEGSNKLGGIVIKAENSAITQYAKHLCFTYADTGAENVLIFDTGPNGRIKFKSKYFERFIDISGAALDFWTSGDCAGSVSSGNEYRSDGTLLCGPLVVSGNLLVDDCIAARLDLVSLDGHVITGQSTAEHGEVGALIDGSSIESAFTYFENRCATLLPAIGNYELSNLCTRESDFCSCSAEFSFRSVDEYRTQDYVLFESRWQQMARLGGVVTSTWHEEAVNDTYPYPGKENFEGTSYRTLDLTLYDVNDSVANNRGINYETPIFNTPSHEILNDSYTVII